MDNICLSFTWIWRIKELIISLTFVFFVYTLKSCSFKWENHQNFNRTMKLLE
jgi:hypothetical protein